MGSETGQGVGLLDGEQFAGADDEATARQVEEDVAAAAAGEPAPDASADYPAEQPAKVLVPADFPDAVDELKRTVETFLGEMRDLYPSYIPQSRRPYETHHAVLQALLRLERVR